MARSEQRSGDELVRLQELLRRCGASRQQRRVGGEQHRAWYERGTGAGPTARYNKLRAHLDRVASYLFGPDTVRFGVHLPPQGRDGWRSAADVVSDEFRARWRESGADLVFARLLEWSLVYGATVGKMQPDPQTGFRLGYTQPWDLGVSREDVPELDEQDVVAHWYALSLPQVERWLRGDPVEAVGLAMARAHAKTPGASRSRQGLVIAGVQGVFPGGTVSGGFPGEPDETGDVLGAMVQEPIVEFVDVWERRMFRQRGVGRESEVFEDWLVTTLADEQEILVQRRNPDLPWTRISRTHALSAELPFFLVVPRPLPDYAWGSSELLGLRRLQEWREDHVDKMRQVMERKLNTSKFFSGVPDFEEAGRALNTPGGAYGTAEPTARMEAIEVSIGEEAFRILHEIDNMFADGSGVPEVLQGEPPQGVRATGQLSMLAGIGAGRIRRMALVVEDQLGAGATKGFHLLQRHDASAYPMGEGRSFLLSQLPPGTHLRVNAHSAAPIYAEQTMGKVAMMARFGWIAGEDGVELIDPPGREMLKIKAQKIGERKAELQAEMLKIQEAKALRPRGRA